MVATDALSPALPILRLGDRGDAQLFIEFRIDQERRDLTPGTIRVRGSILRRFAREIGVPILSLDREMIESFLDRSNVSPRTRFAYLSCLHCFYQWAVDRELTAIDPTAKIRRPRLKQTYPRPADGEKLRAALEAASPMHRCWILLAAYQGLRCQEIAGLQREDVRDQEGVLVVAHAKGGKERVLPLHSNVRAALELLPMPKTGFVFKRPRKGDRYDAQQLSATLNGFLNRNGVDATAHQLRHWFGTNLYASTKDLRLTQEMLGHASPNTTAIYTAFDRDGAGEAIESLDLG